MISGVRVGGFDHHADDVIFVFKNLEISVPALLDVIGKYSQTSGYKVNDSKSSVMPLNPGEKVNLPVLYMSTILN